MRTAVGWVGFAGLFGVAACAPERNSAPLLETATYAAGTVIEVPTLGIYVAVTASDPDGDDMQFRWSVDGVGVRGDDETNVSSTTSTYTVYGANLDGTTLMCIITDGTDDTEIAWPLVYVGD
jgi:hypothetical protein